MTLTVSGLYVYPIKSCRGIPLDRAHVSLLGILHDREWAVVDRKSGKVLTQREVPKLCLVDVAIKDGALAFSSQVCGELNVPIDPDDHPTLLRRNVQVWGDNIVGLDQGIWASGWFSAFLHKDCVLVRIARDSIRRSKGGPPIAFADGYEALIISETSLSDLNARLEEPLPMDRFRPNVVVTGCEAYAEDVWQEITFDGGGVRAEGGKLCVRCPVTTTDQATAARGKEPLKTLATFRKTDKGVVFGRYFSFMNGGCVSLGSSVEIVR